MAEKFMVEEFMVEKVVVKKSRVESLGLKSSGLKCLATIFDMKEKCVLKYYLASAKCFFLLRSIGVLGSVSHRRC